MSEGYKKYVRHMEKQCGEEPSFVVLARYGKKDEAIERILKNAGQVLFDEDVLKKVEYKGITLSLYKTGKMIIHGLEDQEAVITLLNELLAS